MSGQYRVLGEKLHNLLTSPAQQGSGKKSHGFSLGKLMGDIGMGDGAGGRIEYHFLKTRIKGSEYLNDPNDTVNGVHRSVRGGDCVSIVPAKYEHLWAQNRKTRGGVVFDKDMLTREESHTIFLQVLSSRAQKKNGMVSP